MIRDFIRWLRDPLPETDDPHVRRNVVWMMLFLNLIMFMTLVVAASGYIHERQTLDRAVRFLSAQCDSGNHARRQTISRNRAIRAYLLDHDGGGVVRAIKDPLLVNCKTGEEIPRR
jgi:hypothetical protein